MIDLKRSYDWPEKLAEFIDARRRVPFKWGENDCAIFAADAVLAMTGTDLASELRGYKSERGAASRIRTAGGMRGFTSNLSNKPVGFASRGDIVIVAIDGRESFGIVSGNGHWCGAGVDGIIFRPMSEVILVFSV